MKIQSTKDFALTGVSILCYSASGSGKTTLCSTLDKPIILSAESGLLSLVNFDLPYIEIATMADMQDAYEWLLSSEEADQFDSVALDSISEIAEVVLINEKQNNKDGRAAYGEMAAQMTALIRAFRDLPKNVYFSAKLEKQTDEMGKIFYGPSMPGNKTAQALPYFFDEVLALRIEKDAEGHPQRLLQTSPDGLWTAKDRSSRLNHWELPDLGAIIRKIKGESDE